MLNEKKRGWPKKEQNLIDTAGNHQDLAKKPIWEQLHKAAY